MNLYTVVLSLTLSLDDSKQYKTFTLYADSEDGALLDDMIVTHTKEPASVTGLQWDVDSVTEASESDVETFLDSGMPLYHYEQHFTRMCSVLPPNSYTYNDIDSWQVVYDSVAFSCEGNKLYAELLDSSQADIVSKWGGKTYKQIGYWSSLTLRGVWGSCYNVNDLVTLFNKYM